MWCSKVHFTLILFELHFIALDCHPKPETNNTETFEVKQLPDEVVEFINTKPDEPVIREIFFYHIVEKPYLKKDHKTSPDNQELDFDESVRPFTNGQGYQFFDSQSEEPTEKDADDKDIKIRRDFSIDTNDTSIPIHVGNTNKNVERYLDKNKKTEDESTKRTENLKEQSSNNRRKRDIGYQPVMDNHRNVIYTNSPKNIYAENKPFKNKVKNMFKNLPSAKQRHTYGMSLHSGFGNMWNNIQSLPFINKIGSLFTPKVHSEIPIKNKKDMEPVVKENSLPPHITNLEIPPTPKILDSTNIKPDTKSRSNTSVEEQFYLSNVLSTNNSQDSYKDSSSEPEAFTSEKNQINPGKIYVNENQKTSNDDSNELPESNDLTDDTKEAFVNENHINLSNNKNKIDEAPKDNLQSDVDEIDINPIPIKTNIGNNEHRSFYEKLKKSFKNLLNKLPFKRNPLRENNDKENIGPKDIPTTLNENNSGTYGMSLKNNGGFVWNDLDSKHATLINVGETPLVDTKNHEPTEPNADPTVVLAHFKDNIVKTTSSTTATNIHTNQQIGSIETTSHIPTKTENTFTTKNVETTTILKFKTTIGNSHKITETDSTTASDITTPKLITTTDTTQTHVSDTSKTTDAVLTTTEVIKTTAKRSTFNDTQNTTDNSDITTTEYGHTVTNITTIATKEANTKIANPNQDITTQSSSTSIATIGPEVSKNNDIESTTTTSLNKNCEEISVSNAKNSTVSLKSNMTTTESPKVNNSSIEAQQQSKHSDDVPQKNDTKSHSKGESIKSDLNKLLEKKVFWDWLTAWTSVYFEVLDESVKELVREEVALEVKNLTELVKNKHNDEAGVSTTTSIPQINSTKTNEIRKSQNDTHNHITTSKPSANTNDIETNESIKSKNYSSVNIAGDTINGKSVDVTNIFIFMNDNQNNSLKPIVNKYLKDVNDTNMKISESTENVAVFVTSTSRTLLSEKDKEKTMSKSNDTSSITNNSLTIENNTDSSLKISVTTTSDDSAFTTNKIPATENSTNSDRTTEKILTTIQQPNLAVTIPSTQIPSSEKTDFVTTENFNASTISNNLATEKISTTLTTIEKTSTIKSTSVTEPLITTKSANISVEVTTLSTPLENTMTTTKISPINTESRIFNVNTTNITTQPVSSSSPTSENIEATTISSNLATETTSTTLTTTEKTSTNNSTSVTEPFLTTKSANISTVVTTLTTPLENTTITTEISPITTESGVGNLNTTKITTQTVSTTATETLKADSTITTTTTDSSTTSLNKKDSNLTTTPALQTKNNEQTATTLNNTINSTMSTTQGTTTMSTSSFNTENNSNTEATTTISSETKIGVNVTTDASIVNGTLMNSSIKETNSSDSNTTTASGKDINLTTEVTTIKESINNTETQTTTSEPQPNTEGTLANNSTSNNSLPNISTAVPTAMNLTESSTVENSNSTDSKKTQDTKTTTANAAEPTTISTTLLDKANKSDTTTTPNMR